MPLKALVTPLQVKNPLAAALPRTFIYCTAWRETAPPFLARTAERVRADERWRYREIATGHLPNLEAPRDLADLLLELA
jgi:hypothetical protein